MTPKAFFLLKCSIDLMPTRSVSMKTPCITYYFLYGDIFISFDRRSSSWAPLERRGNASSIKRVSPLMKYWIAFCRVTSSGQLYISSALLSGWIHIARLPIENEAARVSISDNAMHWQMNGPNIAAYSHLIISMQHITKIIPHHFPYGMIPWHDDATRYKGRHALYRSNEHQHAGCR